MSKDGSDYAHAVARTAVAQVVYAQAQRVAELRKAVKARADGDMGHVKVRGVNSQPLKPELVQMTKGVSDALADVAMSFIEQLAKDANERAELCGRSHTNLLDVLNSLDMVYSSTHSSVRDLAKYLMFQEVPFPFEVRKFPATPPPRKRKKEIHIEEQDKKERKYIETWMPPLPSAHTFISTPMPQDKTEKKKDASLLREQRLTIEKSLAKLKEAQTTGDKTKVLSKAAASAPDNPYLQPPKIGTDEHVMDVSGRDRPELTEPDTGDIEDATKDMNGNLIEKPKGAIHDQRRARVARIIASDVVPSSTPADTSGM